MRTLLIALLVMLAAPVLAQHGARQERYPDGRVKSTRYMKDGREYVFTYHPNGHLASTCEYVGGVRDGLWRSYDEQGRLLVHACFDQGRRCGTWEFFGEGSLRGRLSFADGVLASGQAYDAEGAVLATRDY